MCRKLEVHENQELETLVTALYHCMWGNVKEGWYPIA